MIDLERLTSVHFIGIGGVGTSAIARMMLDRGIAVSGSDRSASPLTDRLVSAGAIITIGNATSAIPQQCDMVVHTVAIPADNAELVDARRRGLPIVTYPEMLEVISAEKYTVAVSGTHGKTTTTAMLGSILLEAGLDPTVLVGGLMLDPRQKENASTTAFEEQGVNFILNSGKYFVVEADEYKKSFHHLAPRLLIITNIDADHFDFYKDLADIQAAFAELARRVPADGFIVCDPADPHIVPAITSATAQIRNYRQQRVPSLLLPGKHNRANAMAAGAAASALGVGADIIDKALSRFPGTWRRFQYKGTTTAGALVYDDYAHNPQKVAAAIAGARELHPDKRLIVVFQPHLYSRTKHFFRDFVAALTGADQVVLLPIYAAREKLDSSISSEMLADALATVAPTVPVVFDNFAAAKHYLDHGLIAGDVVVTMGAGNITELAQLLIQ